MEYLVGYLTLMKRVPITPADEKRARVGWISEAHPPGGGGWWMRVAIHPTAPNLGCCFIVKNLRQNDQKIFCCL